MASEGMLACKSLYLYWHTLLNTCHAAFQYPSSRSGVDPILYVNVF